MLTPVELTERLRERKLKVTPQRLAVYAALASSHDHPTAETLYKSLRNEYPTMSLATVYKSLDAFCQMGLAQELNVGEEAFRYDADMSHHPHVRCTKCQKVVDVFAKLPSLADNVHESTGFKITDEQFYFFGICPECQKEGLH